MVREVHQPSLADTPRQQEPRLSSSTPRATKKKQPRRSRGNKENANAPDPPPNELPRSFTAIEMAGRRKSSNPRADITTNFAMPEDETLLGDIAPPSDLAGPSTSSLFGSDDHEPASHFVGPRGLGRSGGRGVSGRGGLLTPESSLQLSQSQAQRPGRRVTLQPTPSASQGRVESLATSRSRRSLPQQSYRESEDGEDDEPTPRAPRKRASDTHPAPPPSQRARRPAPSLPSVTPAVARRSKPPATAPQAVIAAEARLRASTPVAQDRRRSTSAVPITPGLQNRTQSWLSTLTPQQRALIPKDVYYGRIEVPIEIEPGDDPLLLEEPGAKRKKKELERRRSLVKKRRVSMAKPRESAAADDTFANQVQRRVARQARTAASSRLRNSVVREESAEPAEAQEIDEDAPANFDSPFVPRTLGHLAGVPRSSPARTPPRPPPDEEDEAEGVDFGDGDFPPDMPSDSGSERELTPGPAERYESLSHLSPSPTPRTSLGEHGTHSTPRPRRLEEEEQTILASEGTRNAVAEALGARMAEAEEEKDEEEAKDEEDEGMAELEEGLAAELDSSHEREAEQPEEPGTEDAVQPEAEELAPEDEQLVETYRSPSPPPAEETLEPEEGDNLPSPTHSVPPAHLASSPRYSLEEPEVPEEDVEEEEEVPAQPEVHRPPSPVEGAVEDDEASAEPVVHRSSPPVEEGPAHKASSPPLSSHRSPEPEAHRSSSPAEEAVDEPVHQPSSPPLSLPLSPRRSPRRSPEESLDNIDRQGGAVIVETAKVDIEVQVTLEEQELHFEGDSRDDELDAEGDTRDEELDAEGDTREDIQPEGNSLEDFAPHRMFSPVGALFHPGPSSAPSSPWYPPLAGTRDEEIDPEGDTREEDIDPEGDTLLVDESEDVIPPPAHQFTSPRLSAVPEEDTDPERSIEEDIDPEGDTREEVYLNNTKSGDDLDPEGDTMDDLDPEGDTILADELSSPIDGATSQPSARSLAAAGSSPVPEVLDASASTEDDDGEDLPEDDGVELPKEQEDAREGSLHDVVAAYNRALGVPSDAQSSPPQAPEAAHSKFSPPQAPDAERAARQARIQPSVLHGSATPLSGSTSSQRPEPEVDLDMPARRRRRQFAGSTPAKPRLSGSLEDIEPPSPGPSQAPAGASPQASPDAPPSHSRSPMRAPPGSSPQVSRDAPPAHARSPMQPPPGSSPQVSPGGPPRHAPSPMQLPFSPFKAFAHAPGPPIPSSPLRSPARGFPSAQPPSLFASPAIHSSQSEGKVRAEPSPARSQHSPARVLTYGDDDARRHFEDRPTPEPSFASSSRGATPVSRASTPDLTSVAGPSHTSQTPGIEVLSLRARTPRSLTRELSASRMQSSPLAGPSRIHATVEIQTAELHVSPLNKAPSPRRPTPPQPRRLSPTSPRRPSPTPRRPSPAPVRRPSPPQQEDISGDTTRDADPSAWDDTMDAEGPTLDGASDMWGNDTMDITQEMDDSMGGYRYDGAEWDVTRIEQVRERERSERSKSAVSEEENAEAAAELRPPVLRVTPAPEDEEDRAPVLRVTPAPEEDEGISLADQTTPRAHARQTSLTPTQTQRSPGSSVGLTPAQHSASVHLTPTQPSPAGSLTPRQQQSRSPSTHLTPTQPVSLRSLSAQHTPTQPVQARSASTHLTPTQSIRPRSLSTQRTPTQSVQPRSPSAHLTPTQQARSPSQRSLSTHLTPTQPVQPRSPSTHLTPKQHSRSPSQTAASVASATPRQQPWSPGVVQSTPSQRVPSEHPTPNLVPRSPHSRLGTPATGGVLAQPSPSPLAAADRTSTQPSPRPRSRASSIASDAEHTLRPPAQPSPQPPHSPQPQHSISVEDIEDEDAPHPTPRRRSRTPSVSEAVLSPRRSPRLSHTSSVANEPVPSPRRSTRLSRSPSVALEESVPAQSPRRSARLSRASTPVAEAPQPSPRRSSRPSSAIPEPQAAQPPHPVEANVPENTWPRLDPARQKWVHEVDELPHTALEPAEQAQVKSEASQQPVQLSPPAPAAGPSQPRRLRERYPIPEHCIEKDFVNFVVHERVIDVTLVKDESDEEDEEDEREVIHVEDSRDEELDEGNGEEEQLPEEVYLPEEEHFPEEENQFPPMDGSEGMAYEEEEDSRIAYEEEDGSRLDDSLENPHMDKHIDEHIDEHIYEHMDDSLERNNDSLMNKSLRTDDSLENDDSRMEYDDSLEDSDSRMEYEEYDKMVVLSDDHHCGLTDVERGDEAEHEHEEAGHEHEEAGVVLPTDNVVERATTPRPASASASPVHRTPVATSQRKMPGSRSSAPSPATPGRAGAPNHAGTPSQARTPSGHARTPGHGRNQSGKERTPSTGSPTVAFNLRPQLSLPTGGSEPSRRGLEALGLLGAGKAAMDGLRQIGTPQSTRPMPSTTPQVPPPSFRPGSNTSVSSTPLQPPPAFRGQSTTPIIPQGPQTRPVTTTPAAPPPRRSYPAQAVPQLAPQAPQQTQTQERSKPFDVADAGPGPSSQRPRDAPTSRFESPRRAADPQHHLPAEPQQRFVPAEPQHLHPRREPQRNQLLRESHPDQPRYPPETHRPAVPSALSRQVLPSAESTPEPRRSLRESRSLPEGYPRSLHDELESSRISHLERSQRSRHSRPVQTYAVDDEYGVDAHHTPGRGDTSHFDSPAPPVPGGWTRTPRALPRSPRRVNRGTRPWTTSDWRRLENFYDAERSRAATWTPFTRSQQWSVGRVVDNFITRMQLEERELVDEWSRDDLEIRVRALDNAADYRERARSVRRSQRAGQESQPPSTLRRVVDWALGRSTNAPEQAPQAAPRQRERTDPEMGFLRRVDESFDPDVTVAATPSQLPRARPMSSGHERPRTQQPDSSMELANTSEEYEREQTAEHHRLQSDAARERQVPSRSPRHQHHPRDLANIDRAVNEHRRRSANDYTYGGNDFPDTTYDNGHSYDRSPSPQPTEIEDESYRYNAASPRLYNLYPPLPDRSAALAQSVATRPRVIEGSPRPAARPRSATLPSTSPLASLRQSTRHTQPSVTQAASAFTAHASADLSYESERRARERERLAGLRRVRSEVDRLRAAGHDISDESFESFRSFNEELNASVRALGRSVSGGSGRGRNVSGGSGSGRHVSAGSGRGGRGGGRGDAREERGGGRGDGTS